MLKRRYNPWQIANSGEKEADKQFSVPGCPDEPIHVIHSLRLSSRYHRTQMAGECDFVVLTVDGIMVIEVKGGIIGYGTRPDGSTGFYRMVSRAREPLDNNLYARKLSKTVLITNYVYVLYELSGMMYETVRL